MLQDFLQDSLKLNGTTVELRTHVIVARAEPLLVMMDPEFVVKHVKA